MTGRRRRRRFGLTKRERAQLTALQEMSASIQPKEIDYKKKKDAELFLKEMFQLEIAKFNIHSGLWRDLVWRDQRFLVRGAHHRYRLAISYVYAIYEWVINYSGYIDLHVDAIYARAGIEPSPKRPLLNVLLGLLIEYDPERREDASRDAQAIRWLMSQNVAPHEVEKYYQKCGGGVDEWSRLAAVKRPTTVKTISTDAVDSRAEPAPSCASPDENQTNTDAVETSAESAPSDKRHGDSQTGDGAGSQTSWVRKRYHVGADIEEDYSVMGVRVGEEGVLRYAVGEKSLAPGEGMVIFIAGDSSIPIGARLLRIVNLGPIPQGREQQTGIINLLIRVIRRLMGPKQGSWAWAAAQAASLSPENQ